MNTTTETSSQKQLPLNMPNRVLFGVGCFKVGDTAYYRSPGSRYAIRKAQVVKVEEKHRHVDRNIFIPYDVLTLENGIELNASAAFATRQEAESCLIAELKTRLTFQQVALDNLQHEMAYETSVLERLEKRK